MPKSSGTRIRASAIPNANEAIRPKDRPDIKCPLPRLSLSPRLAVFIAHPKAYGDIHVVHPYTVQELSGVPIQNTFI